MGAVRGASRTTGKTSHSLSTHNDVLARGLHAGMAVLWSRLAATRLRCNMGFGRLPFDKQHCLFLVGIYSETAADVHLTWTDIKTPFGADLANFRDVGGEWQVGGIRAANLLDVYPSGVYSYAKACVSFERDSYQSMMKIILATMFVLMVIPPQLDPGAVAHARA
eukprot:5560770-Prymnesium_polylepis.1